MPVYSVYISYAASLDGPRFREENPSDMTKVGLRTYKVSPADFPIQVEILAKKLNDNDAVPGDVQITRGGATTSVPVVVTKPNRITKTFPIQDPTGTKCTMVQTTACFFPPAAPSDASYQFTITSTGGDVETTIARVPTISPNLVNLTFLYK